MILNTYIATTMGTVPEVLGACMAPTKEDAEVYFLGANLDYYEIKEFLPEISTQLKVIPLIRTEREEAEESYYNICLLAKSR